MSYPLILNLLVLLLAAYEAPDALYADTWTQRTFEDFREGSSDDGGVALYAAGDSTVRTTMSFDYNRDGANDLLFVCSHDNNYAPPAYIYTNNGGSFDSRFRWVLLNAGAHGGALADLNADGWPEAILCGTTNGMNFSALDAIVFFGGEQGYATRRSVRMPTFQSRSVAVLDCNDDGQLDLVFAQGKSPGLIIYYGEQGRFDSSRHRTISCPAVSWVRAFDVDANGRDDLIALARERLLVYMNDSAGLKAQPAFDREVKGSGRFSIGDLNGDRRADLVVADAKPQSAEIFIYHGQEDGFFPEKPSQALPAVSARDAAIADFNADGRADIAVACYGRDDATGGSPSLIYWGHEDGFRAKRRSELDVRFAQGVAAADLNTDQRPDLILACHRNDTSHNVPSYVYWNRAPDGFSEAARTGLPTLGAMTSSVGDVDHDGELDVLFLNSVDGTKGLSDARLYWNDGRGRFSTDRMLRLPIRDAFSHVAADLNLDGYLDIVLANSYEYAQFREKGSYIYWGSADDTWSPLRRTLVSTSFATGVVAADLNRDGWIDLAFAQLVSWEEGFKAEDRRSPVFWGSRNGFSTERRTDLPVEDPRGLTIADLNKDGWIDLIFSNLTHDFVPIFWGSKDGYSSERLTKLKLADKGSVSLNCADVNADGWLDLLVVCPHHFAESGETTVDRDSYLFLGSSRGFDDSRCISLPTMSAQGSCIADWDKDGRLDVFLPSYSNGDRNRTWMSFLYYNGPDGFSSSRRTGLITDGGSGAVALDYDRDDWLDLAVACHISPNGDHRARSLLFWGGPFGFDDYRRIELPTEGSHDITNIDAGHIYHRRFEYNYISGIRESAADVGIAGISWRADTPLASRIRFQVRAAPTREALETSTWVGPSGQGSYFETPGPVRAAISGRFIQYRAQFISADGSNYPVLREVNINLN